MTRKAAHSGGFSLLEVVMVLAVLSVLLGIAVPTFSGAKHRLSARQAAQVVVSEIHRAEAIAFTTGEPVEFSVTSERDRIVVVDQATSGRRSISPTTTEYPIELYYVKAGATVGQITLSPRGAASDRMVLAVRSGSIAVRIGILEGQLDPLVSDPEAWDAVRDLGFTRSGG